MDDESARAAGSMWPTGQGAGACTDPDRAMTAPGGLPSAPGRTGEPPEVHADHFAATNRTDGGELPGGASWDATDRDWPGAPR